MNPNRTSPRFWSLTTVACLLATLYSVAVAGWMLTSALEPDAGEWDGMATLVLGIFLGPAIAIPVLWARAFRRRQGVRIGRFLPWVFRAMYVSVILALVDTWAVTTERRNSLFSGISFAARDGTQGYTGFGYFLTRHGQLAGWHGPTVVFWFVPIRFDWTADGVRAGWLWTKEAP
jgi:hypothetical protein